jgi:peroxiredoxin
MSLTVGMTAPDFTLIDTAKNKFTLSEQKGKNVLLLFFPLAFTSVCTKELCAIRDDIGKYNNANAVVFGISADSYATLKKFKEVENYNFTLLSDFNKEVSTKFNCLYEEFQGWMKGVSKRAAFIIDKQGLVQYAEVLENAGDMPNFEVINLKLAQLN